MKDRDVLRKALMLKAEREEREAFLEAASEAGIQQRDIDAARSQLAWRFPTMLGHFLRFLMLVTWGPIALWHWASHDFAIFSGFATFAVLMCVVGGPRGGGGPG